MVARYKLKFKKLYKKKIEDLLNCYDRFDSTEGGAFLAPGMIFAFDLEPIEKPTLFAMAKGRHWRNNRPATYKDLAADVGCSEERIIEALHVINERFDSGEIYRNIPPL